jgi:heme/copper-type cytochrome/quinol oxidase subunit 4
MDVGDLSLGVIITIIALVTAWGECSSTKHRIAALMAILCIVRNGLQLIRLLMAVRK